METEISLQCSQKPSAESLSQAVEFSPHFVSQLPKTDFDFVFQSICFQFFQVSHTFSAFIHDKIEIIYWKSLVLVDGVWGSYIIQLLPFCVHICMFTRGWHVSRTIAQGATTHFTKESCAPNCLLCGGPKGTRTLNLVYYLLQLQQGKRITVLVIAITWTCRENIWT